jgi:hypothetical protein
MSDPQAFGGDTHSSLAPEPSRIPDYFSEGMRGVRALISARAGCSVCRKRALYARRYDDHR